MPEIAKTPPEAATTPGSNSQCPECAHQAKAHVPTNAVTRLYAGYLRLVWRQSLGCPTHLTLDESGWGAACGCVNLWHRTDI